MCDACKQCYNTKFDKTITLCCLYRETPCLPREGAVTQKYGGGRAAH